MPGMNRVLYDFYKRHGDEDGIAWGRRIFHQKKKSKKQIKKEKREFVNFLVDNLGYETTKITIKQQRKKRTNRRSSKRR